MKKIFLFIFLALSLVGCAKENTTTSTTTPDVKIDQYQTNAGKNTFVGFVATWCPHCKDEIPVFDEFYRENKDNVNMVLFVQDKKKFEGDFIVPQEITNPLSYEQVTGETCGYVPSYVIFDSNKKIIDKKCGAKLSKQDLETKLLTKEIPMSELQSKGFENGDLGVVLTTSNGKIEIKMFPNEAPKTVLNFLGLVQKGYYNGIIFHRVINGFMIQGGDPTGTGMGGESLFGGEFEDEFNPNLGNFRGSLSMANAGANTNGSQFFINQVNNNGLDYVHSVFGQVITGMDNVDKIAKTKVGANDKPVKDVKIIKAEVVQFENGKLKTITYDYESKIKEIDDAKASLIAEKGDTVKVNYVLTDNDSGEEYDNSYKKGQAFPVVIGAEGTLLKFNESLKGMKIGDKKTIVLTPKEAYGELNNPEALKEFNKSEFYEFEKNGIKIEAGAKIPTQYGELKIAKVEGDKVTIDFTHPLAGKTLKFDIEMMNITKATK